MYLDHRCECAISRRPPPQFYHSFAPPPPARTRRVQFVPPRLCSVTIVPPRLCSGLTGWSLTLIVLTCSVYLVGSSSTPTGTTWRRCSSGHATPTPRQNWTRRSGSTRRTRRSTTSCAPMSPSNSSSSRRTRSVLIGY